MRSETNRSWMVEYCIVIAVMTGMMVYDRLFLSNSCASCCQFPGQPSRMTRLRIRFSSWSFSCILVIFIWKIDNVFGVSASYGYLHNNEGENAQASRLSDDAYVGMTKRASGSHLTYTTNRTSCRRTWSSPYLHPLFPISRFTPHTTEPQLSAVFSQAWNYPPVYMKLYL